MLNLSDQCRSVFGFVHLDCTRSELYGVRIKVAVRALLNAIRNVKINSERFRAAQSEICLSSIPSAMRSASDGTVFLTKPSAAVMFADGSVHALVINPAFSPAF